MWLQQGKPIANLDPQKPWEYMALQLQGRQGFLELSTKSLFESLFEKES